MVIIGAGGFAKELLEMIVASKQKEKIFLYDDIDKKNKCIGKYVVLNRPADLKKIFKTNNTFILGIGDAKQRESLYKKITLLGGKVKTIISSNAYIGKLKVSIGDGSIICAGTNITTHIQIGTGCLINLGCTVGHDTIIGKFCVLSPRVSVSGKCTIGDFCQIGTGAIILPGITLGSYVTVGAGSVLTKDVPDNTTVVGVPAKQILKAKKGS